LTVKALKQRLRRARVFGVKTMLFLGETTATWGGWSLSLRELVCRKSRRPSYAWNVAASCPSSMTRSLTSGIARRAGQNGGQLLGLSRKSKQRSNHAPIKSRLTDSLDGTLLVSGRRNLCYPSLMCLGLAGIVLDPVVSADATRRNARRIRAGCQRSSADTESLVGLSSVFFPGDLQKVLERLFGDTPHLPGLEPFEPAFIEPVINRLSGDAQTLCNLFRCVDPVHTYTPSALQSNTDGRSFQACAY